MAQRACTLTFKSSDASTHTITLPAGAPLTPKHCIAKVISEGGFWSGDAYNGTVDNTGVTAGSVWVPWSQIVLVTTS